MQLLSEGLGGDYLNTEKAATTKINLSTKLFIATGRSRKETKWKNVEITYQSLIEKLKTTTRTRETFSEYKRMSKAQRDEIKDVGGFVGGSLKGGRRKAENIANRTLLTLDMDSIDISVNDVWDSITMINDFEILMYSTHSHEPKAPRLRLIIPLDRPVLPDEYQAIARKIADDIGIDMFDDTTYEPCRLMYWPSTSSDGEYIFKRQEGPWLNPDEVLNTYLDWRDTSFWPVSSRQNIRIQSQIKKQEDPLEKKGIIGAFCRTYSISEVINNFLSDIYVPTKVEGRYTYAEGSTVGGLVVYEDKFAYSHHGTDPASGILCNAFDLVRIHKFGARDEEAKENTPVNRMPSFTAMSEFASNDDDVKTTLGTERLDEALEDFEFEFEDGEETEEIDKEWLKLLEYDKKGQITNTIKNVVTVLENDPLLKGKLGFNEFANRIIILGKLPWNKNVGADWEDSDDAGLRFYLESVYNITQKSKIDDALAIVFKKNTFNPVRDYLDSLTWDGQERVETLLIDYLGADDNKYVRTVTRKWVCGAVARILQPGIKFDYMMVLTGEQGINKSSFFNILAKEWFTDSIQDVQGNQAVEKLLGSWIIEFGELQAFNRAESNAIKRFITSQEDRTRLAYDRRASYLKRQCVFAGTTNKSEFLKDETGNRRFWPVEVKKEGRTKDVFKDLVKERDQIWAEAVVLWRDKKEKLYLTEEEEKLAQVSQEDHREVNEKEGLILKYLDTLLPDDWEDRDLYERKTFLEGADVVEGTEKRERVCVLEIWCECFGNNKSQLKKADSLEINGILSNLKGWKKEKDRYYFSLYGQQRGYRRVD